MTLKEKIRQKEITIGSWVTIGHPSIAEIMARVGFDWIVLDLEHSVIELSDLQSSIQNLDAFKVPSIARLTSNNADQIKRVMDAGAHGIMVPMVISAEEARLAVEAVYYPPKGKRGVGLARAQGYGASFAEYVSWLEENAIIIVMIEHIDAVANIEDIFSVDGVDGYIIGPYDLSSSIGVPGDLENREVTDLIAKIQEAGERAGIPGGIHLVEPNIKKVKEFVDKGLSIIGYGMDVRVLDSIYRSHLERIRDLL